MLHLIARRGWEEGKQIAQFFVNDPRGWQIDFLLPEESRSKAEICLFMIIFEEIHTFLHSRQNVSSVRSQSHSKGDQLAVKKSERILS